MPNIFSGFVTKTGVMRKTITVTVHRKFEHPKLLKTMHRTTKILVHDEQESTLFAMVMGGEGGKIIFIATAC